MLLANTDEFLTDIFCGVEPRHKLQSPTTEFQQSTLTSDSFKLENIQYLHTVKIVFKPKHFLSLTFIWSVFILYICVCARRASIKSFGNLTKKRKKKILILTFCYRHLIGRTFLRQFEFWVEILSTRRHFLFIFPCFFYIFYSFFILSFFLVIYTGL